MNSIKKIFLFFLLSFLPVGLMAGDHVAVMIKSNGPVTVQRVEDSKKVPAKTGYSFVSGDKVITGKEAFAAVRFLDDKSLLRIRENSVCTIEGKKEQEKIEKSIWVEIGSFFASVFKPKGTLKVITPTSVASIKGTKFWIIHDPMEGTKYIGIEGVVEISNSKGKALMKPGETCIVTSADEPPIVRETRDDDFPPDSEEVMGNQLELEFRNQEGSSKSLKLELQPRK